MNDRCMPALEQSEGKLNQEDPIYAQISTELLRIEDDCIHSGKAHFNADYRWSCYHYWLGIPSVALSAVVGAAFMKGYPELAAGFSAVITVLTALMTFLKPSERASAHKSSGDQYLSLRNDARVFRQIKLLHSCDEQSSIDGLDEFTKRRNELNTASPTFTRADYEKARDGVNKGEATHQIDTVRP